MNLSVITPTSIAHIVIIIVASVVLFFCIDIAFQDAIVIYDIVIHII